MDLVLLLVERDTSTRIPVEVPECEVAVLERLHGPEFVTEISRRKGPEIDADETRESMVRRYGLAAVQAAAPAEPRRKAKTG